jgi:hypothetical protein
MLTDRPLQGQHVNIVTKVTSNQEYQYQALLTLTLYALLFDHTMTWGEADVISMTTVE